MNKRIIAILCVAVLMVTSLTACSSTESGKKTTINGIEIIEQFYLNSVLLIMTNKTGNDCDLSISFNYTDINGDTVETENDHCIYAFGKDMTIAEEFGKEVTFYSYTYDVTVKPISDYTPIDADLKATVKKESDTETITLTNEGTSTAEDVEVYLCFYKGGELVQVYNGYLNDDHEIKPGETQVQSARCLTPYNKAKVYVHGVAKKES